MAFALKRENEIESWLRPFTGPVTMLGYQRRLHTNTRIFFDLYWQLLAVGYTEQQIADYAVEWRWPSRVPNEVAIVLAVFDLARRRGLARSREFVPQVDLRPRHAA